MITPIATAARIVAELRERTKVEQNIEDGDPFLEGSLEGATDLPEMQAALARRIVTLEDRADKVRERAKSLDDFAARLDAQAGKARVDLSWSLQEAGWKRVPVEALPEITVTLSVREPNAEIPNDDAVPDDFCIIKVIKRPDKKMITEHLKRGERFDFAHLPNPKPTLTIRPR